MLIGFKIGDVESLCIDLEKKQVKFYKKLAVEPFAKHATIEDPDGHLISLAELLQKRNLCRYRLINHNQQANMYLARFIMEK